MLLEFAILITAAMLMVYLFSFIKLPGIIGMIAVGILFGPSGFDIVGEETKLLLSEFKTVALIVILLRAGLGIKKSTLKKIGKPAINMSFIPGVIEGLTVMLLSIYLLGFTWIEGGMLGFIIAAVSPAVVVPQMLILKEKGLGAKRDVPTLILAGASLDDVFAITIFGVFVSLAAGQSVQVGHLLWSVPTGIAVGALVGVLLGLGLVWFFKHYHLRDTQKVIIFMIVSIFFYTVTEEESVKAILPIAGLLGIMAIGFVILERYETLAVRISAKLSKVWVLAEILLFVYIGTKVQLQSINLELVGVGLLILLIGLIARSIGVWLSLIRSPLTYKEKIFSIIAYWPKATVQAAIGAVPLTLIMQGKLGSVDVQTGETILTIAVLAIIVTAPLGAIGVRIGGDKLLD